MRKQKKVILAVFTFLAAVAIGTAIYTRTDSYQRSKNQKTAEENHAKNDTPANSNPSNKSAQDKASGTSANSTNHGSPPTKPTLLKSSGNRSAVPSGSKIQFVCQTDIGAQCTIKLVSERGSSLDLGTKTVQNDRTDQHAVDWYWDAMSGTWTVTAVASNSAGSVSSDPQTLEVQ